MERIPLPAANGDEEMGGAELLGWLMLVPVLLALLALTVYGGVQFWQEIAQGWF